MAGRSGLDSFVDELEPIGSERGWVRLDALPDRVGGFEVEEGRRTGDYVFLTVSGAGVLGRCGFAHIPGGVDPIEDASWLSTIEESLGGDWYVWCGDLSGP